MFPFLLFAFCSLFRTTACTEYTIITYSTLPRPDRPPDSILTHRDPRAFVSYHDSLRFAFIKYMVWIKAGERPAYAIPFVVTVPLCLASGACSDSS